MFLNEFLTLSQEQRIEMTFLDLSCLTEEDLKSFIMSGALSQCLQLKKLNLKNNNLGSLPANYIKHFAMSLISLENLESLWLGGNQLYQFSDASWMHLGKGISQQKFKNLRMLDLSNNNLNMLVNEWVSIGRLLVASRITSIDISQNNLRLLDNVSWEKNICETLQNAKQTGSVLNEIVCDDLSDTRKNELKKILRRSLPTASPKHATLNHANTNRHTIPEEKFLPEMLLQRSASTKSTTPENSGAETEAPKTSLPVIPIPNPHLMWQTSRLSSKNQPTKNTTNVNVSQKMAPSLSSSKFAMCSEKLLAPQPLKKVLSKSELLRKAYLC